MKRLPLILLLILPLAGAYGCTRWDVNREEKKPWKLPAPRMSPNTVVIEVAFIRVNPKQPEEVYELWQQVDEQVLPTDLRRRLNDNGIRCGTIGTHLPALIQRQLSQSSDPLDVGYKDPEKLADDITSRQYRLQSREGARTPIAVAENAATLNVLMNEDGVIRGETFHLAQCMFSLRTYPKGDGRVQLELTPEIEHGEPRNRRVGQEGVWRLEFSRDRKAFESLRVDSILSPGEVFVLSATQEPVGLGQSFFVKAADQTTMVLIRVAQTQKDDLFEATRSEL